MPAAVQPDGHCWRRSGRRGCRGRGGRSAVGETGAGAATGSGAGAGAAAFAGIFSFCPTLISVVVRLFSDSIALTVVPCGPGNFRQGVAGFDGIGFLVTSARGSGGHSVGCRGSRTAGRAGIESFCPTFNLVGSTPGLAAFNALSVTPFFLAIFASVSPLTTTYSVAAVSGDRGSRDNRRRTALHEADWMLHRCGKLVSHCRRQIGFRRRLRLLSVSVCSRLQPWMSMAVRPSTSIASTQNTANFMRERVCFAAPEVSLGVRMGSDYSWIWR